MEQKSFDFNHHKANPIYLQLPDELQQQLVDLMASLIINVIQPIEDSENDHSNKQQS